MDVIHTGHGARTEAWLDLVHRHKGMTSVAVVGAPDRAGGKRVPAAFPDLGGALESTSGELVIATGADAVDRALEALEAGRRVLLDEPGRPEPEKVLALQERAASGGLYTDGAAYTYARCERTLRRFLDSGRLGSIGHVACLDVRAQSVTDLVSATCHRHFQDLARLLSATPLTVMARLGHDPRETVEAFLELSDGIHIHYFAAAGAADDAHSLWLEGSGGSLRTDGAGVWWRKRGWPVFVPVKLGFGGAPSPSPQQRVLDDIARSPATTAPDLRGIAMAAAALQSDANGAPARVPLEAGG